MPSFDWILAQASSVGRSNRSIIRVSGVGCFTLLDQVYLGQLDLSKGYRFFSHYLKVFDHKIPVIVYIMKGTASYTREDSFELHLPGSQYVVGLVMECLLSLGCHMAEPGEFTKRAFLNGRIDLIQAESVTKLIAARSEEEYRKAYDALSGRVTSLIAPLRENLFFLVRDLTVDIDFDEEIENEHLSEVLAKLDSFLIEIDRLIAEVALNRDMQDRLKVIFCGPVNAGKSTIFNQFTGEETAIVSSVKGTTRDVLQVEIEIDGHLILLQDSPGWGEAVDEIDEYAQAQSQAMINSADIVVVVLDANRSLDEQLPLVKLNWLARSFLVLNKSDLVSNIDESAVCHFFQLAQDDLIRVSGQLNITALKEKLSDTCQTCQASYGASQLSARQQNELLEVKDALLEAKKAIEQQIGIDAAEFELRRALKALSRVTGDEVDENILTSIFEGFCIGK